ncbi:TerD family protein [Psychromonas sp. SP041]|uniref:TerD family protein n=1 Tax=Psychromonas sp. SP041 TaxID=1365007 RepID=UPI0010C7B8FF|nr:TerD family protein [Psychromonas sp. SP041]
MTKMISLAKGERTSLTKKNKVKLNKIIVGLGWKANKGSGLAIDMDASAIMLNESGQAESMDDFIYYDHECSPCGSIMTTGDDEEGDDAVDAVEIEGDCEQLVISLNDVPDRIKSIVIVTSIYDAKNRKQDFSKTVNSYIRLIDAKDIDFELNTIDDISEDVLTEKTFCKHELVSGGVNETAFVFAEFYREGNGWGFKANSEGFKTGLGGVGRSYGLPLSDE